MVIIHGHHNMQSVEETVVSSYHHVWGRDMRCGVLACGSFVVKVSKGRPVKSRCPMLPRMRCVQKCPDWWKGSRADGGGRVQSDHRQDMSMTGPTWTEVPPSEYG